MRIGLISPCWLPVPPTGYGAIEILVDALARGLVEAGHDVLLAAPADSTCPVPKPDGMAMSGVPASPTDHVIAELQHIGTAYRAMRDVDLVHDHTVAGPLYRQRPAGLPVVTTNHGRFTSALGDLYRAVGPDVRVVAISHHQASTAAGVPITAVIHHGIDVSAIPVGSGSGGYAAFLGRMSPDKGVREAILVARRAGIPLRIAARLQDRGEREYFASQVRPLLGPEAEYLGELGESDKYRLLGDAVALLNPMQWPEPFGLVMIEALATGTPVVATPRGAAPEIVEDGGTGFLRDGTDPLAVALAQTDRLDRTACRHAAESRFSVERMVAEHIVLYSRVLREAAAQG